MGALAQFLMSMVGPLLIQGLLSLGIGYLTVKGVDLGVSALSNLIYARVGGLPSDMAAIMGRMGFGQALGYVLGATAFVMSYLTASKAFRSFRVLK